jgi:hypothetical protein
MYVVQMKPVKGEGVYLDQLMNQLVNPLHKELPGLLLVSLNHHSLDVFVLPKFVALTLCQAAFIYRLQSSLYN